MTTILKLANALNSSAKDVIGLVEAELHRANRRAR